MSCIVFEPDLDLSDSEARLEVVERLGEVCGPNGRRQLYLRGGAKTREDRIVPVRSPNHDGVAMTVCEMLYSDQRIERRGLIRGRFELKGDVHIEIIAPQGDSTQWELRIDGSVVATVDEKKEDAGSAIYALAQCVRERYRGSAN